jgi:hypothetical protein
MNQGPATFGSRKLLAPDQHCGILDNWTASVLCPAWEQLWARFGVAAQRVRFDAVAQRARFDAALQASARFGAVPRV